MKNLFIRYAFSFVPFLLIFQTPALNAATYLERAYLRPSVDLPKYKPDNLYDNAKDMVVLSQYIYLHAEMVAEAQEQTTNGWTAYVWPFTLITMLFSVPLVHMFVMKKIESGSSHAPQENRQIFPFTFLYISIVVLYLALPSVSPLALPCVSSTEMIEKRVSALSSAKTIGDIVSLANDRTDLFSVNKGGSNVAESAKVCQNDLSDADNIGRTSDSSIEVIHADKGDTARSCVYAITKHEEQKRIVVIFRGTSSSGDWLKDILISQNHLANPMTSKASKVAAKVGIHSGFANALLRNDEEPTGYLKQILGEVKQVMEENPTHKLFITGHSLGGALATLFGFYVASNDDPIYTKNGPVQVYSVSSPRTGNKAFRETFKYLEQRGKIRHARIYNARDKVAMLPYVGGFYKHVGLGVKLRFKDLPIRLDYPRYEGWVMESNTVSLWQQIIAIPEAVKFHGCQLVRNRLKSAKDSLSATTLEIEYKKMWGITD